MVGGPSNSVDGAQVSSSYTIKLSHNSNPKIWEFHLLVLQHDSEYAQAVTAHRLYHVRWPNYLAHYCPGVSHTLEYRIQYANIRTALSVEETFQKPIMPKQMNSFLVLPTEVHKARPQTQSNGHGEMDTISEFFSA